MPFYMEENLDAPMRDVLGVIQHRILTQTTYFGIPTYKCPLDYWVYQELLCECQPDVIVEIGNHKGGSTLALAHICDHLGRGRVVGVDVSHVELADLARVHPRITLVEGDAISSIERVRSYIGKDDKVLVVEDSSHGYENTLGILRTYSDLLGPGDYFIVEDSNLHHGVPYGADPGPWAAIEEFLKKCADFESDRGRESFGITCNPKGYLRRVSTSGAAPRPTQRRTLTWERAKRVIMLFVPPIGIRLWRMMKA